MVSPALTADLARFVAAYLTERATVLRPQDVTGTLGEQARERVVIAADVPCRVIEARQERLTGLGEAQGRERAAAVVSVILAADAPEVAMRDVIVVGGRELHVVAVNAGLTDRVFQRAQAVVHG